MMDIYNKHKFKFIMSIYVYIFLFNYAKADIFNLQQYISDKSNYNDIIYFNIPKNYLSFNNAIGLNTWMIDLKIYIDSLKNRDKTIDIDNEIMCKGYCNGRLLVTLENRTNVFDKKDMKGKEYKNMGDFVASKSIAYLKFRSDDAHLIEKNEKPQYGFQEEYRLYDITDPKNKTNNANKDMYESLFLHKDSESGDYDTAMECLPGVYPICSVHFSNSCNKSIYITINQLSIKNIDEALFVKSKVDRLVSGFMFNNNCI